MNKKLTLPIVGQPDPNVPGDVHLVGRYALGVTWADAHGVGYEAWTWDTWGTCLSLIATDAGAPYSGYGQWVQSYYAQLAQAPVPTATPMATATPAPVATDHHCRPR